MSARSEGFLIPTARRDEHYHWQNYSRRSIIFYNGVFQQNPIISSLLYVVRAGHGSAAAH
jgi:hypothetical protein